MNIAVLGTDPRAVAIGRLIAAAGYQVEFADSDDSRAAERAAAIADNASESTTPYTAAATCDVLFFACPRDEMQSMVTKIGRLRSETVIVDAMEGPSDSEMSGAEALAHVLDSRRVVRALIVLPQPGANVALCGDDPDAVTMVDTVLRTAGCVTTDRGPLANAAEIEAPKNGSTAETPVVTGEIGAPRPATA